MARETDRHVTGADLVRCDGTELRVQGNMITSERAKRGLVCVAVIAAALCCACLAAGPLRATAKKTPPFAPDSTYAQRVAASGRNQPVKGESLVLPHPHVKSILPGPAIWKAGQKPSRRYGDADRFFWTSVPIKTTHAEYLEKRKEMLDPKQISTLVSWCERNSLPICAEFELRRLLFNRMNFRDPGYQVLRRRWIRYADRRQIAMSFPLPVEGAWYVSMDRSGHHRIKHGAAYAWDLVIKRGRSVHKGDIRTLEDHYAWGQRVIAQADGVVTHADDRNPDMPIGKSGGFANANAVVVDYGGGVKVMYGHLQQKSIQVKVGQRVTTGQWLGNVGNSGASGMPHLHFTFLDGANFSIKGRYRCQVLSYGKWKPHEAKDLRGGTTVRNIPPPDEKPAR